MRMRGSRSSCTAWRATENAPEMTACEAITVAAAASTSIHGSTDLGNSSNRG